MTTGISRKTTLRHNVPFRLLVPSGSNPPNRTDAEDREFREFVAFVKAGGAIPPISVVLNPATGQLLIVNGHRRSAVAEFVGLTGVDANITYPNPGEDPFVVRSQLFMSENKHKKFAGKEFFFVMMKSNGKELMSDSMKKAWATIQRHVPSAKDREWLMVHGTKELLDIALKITDYAHTYYTREGQSKLPFWYSTFFRKTMHWLIDFECQRAARDYVNKGKSAKILVNAIENNRNVAKISKPKKTASSEAFAS